MTEWNLGEEDSPKSDLFTDALNDGHGHLVASGAYYSGHGCSDDAPDLHEAGDKNDEPADELSWGLKESVGFIAHGDDDQENVSGGTPEVSKNFLRKAHAPWLDASHFYQWSNSGPLKSAAHARSEALAAAHGRSVVRSNVAHGKHGQSYEGMRIR